MQLLAEHPEELAMLRADPTLIPKYVDEMMHYDSPAQAIIRLTTREVDVGGTMIPEGAVVLALVGSANRDENKYQDPDTFNINRGEVGLGFGFGAPYCIGASLARMEMWLGLEALVSRFRAFEIAPCPIPWKVALTMSNGPPFAGRDVIRA
jgi:cytochrome P450